PRASRRPGSPQRDIASALGAGVVNAGYVRRKFGGAVDILTATDHRGPSMTSRFRTTSAASGEPCSRLTLMRLRIEPRREAAAIDRRSRDLYQRLAERSEMVPS